MADVYKIAVSLAMTSNAPAFMSALSAKLLHAHTQVKDLEGGLNRLNRIKLAVGGGLAVMGGAATLSTLGKMVDKGNELVKVQQNMAAAGVKAADVQEAYAKSWELTRKYTNVGAAEVMKTINEARMTFGSQHDATNHVEDFIKMISFLKAFQGGKHGGGANSFISEANAAMKSGELAGKISPQDMAEHVKQLTAMRVAYGEQLKISQYLTAQRAGGVALRNTSDEFRYGMFPALVQENGPGAGVMLMTAFNKIVAGVGNKTDALGAMQKMGLLNADQIKMDKNGRAIGLKDPSAILNNKDAAINFGSWVHDTLRPLLAKATEGLSGTEKGVRESQLISKMFPDRNAAKAITEVLQQYTKLTKDAALMAEARKALDERGYLDQSWEGQKQAFHEQWENFIQALGAPMVGRATSALRSLNATLTDMASWASRPEMAGTVQAIGKGLAVTAAALTGAGAAALLAALGPAGWLVGGITATVGAWAAIDAEGFKATLLGIKNAAVYVYEAVKGFIFEPATFATLTGFWRTAKEEALRLYESAKGFVQNPEFLAPLREFIQATKTEALAIFQSLKDMAADPQSAATVRGTLTTTFAEVKWVVDWYRQVKDLTSGLGGKVDAPKVPSMGFDLNGDLMGQLSTKLFAGFKTLDGAFREIEAAAGRWFVDLATKIRTGAEDMVKEITSWPSRLLTAITAMGTGIVDAISAALAAAISKINPFSKTSLEGGGEGLSGMIQRASLSSGANDNFGGGVRGVIGRAAGSGGLGGGGGTGGGSIPALPGTVQMTDDERNKLGLILRYESHGHNVMNYMGRRQGLHPQTAKGYTAQGYFQMLNSNWRRIAPGLGITAPNAMAGSLEDQTRVALHLLRNGGIKNWSNYNPALRGALSRGERAPVGTASPTSASPTAGPPPKRQEQPGITHVHLDGKVIARAVTTRMASAAKYPNHVGGMDTHGGWRPPGTTLTDAA